ncbi:rod shape-determining protein MreD [bacterium (Candidatus Howlettbacteria) CG_4_10_14_0_8_um_filter_40_9]|nr:MAG: rod shape-determining protein MreD [bacterium (Candidatus Howlettbacteria) CG_4_10_14_0_8_um_filter_40_9]
MSFIYSFILLIIAFFIQVSVLGNIRLFGIVPDIMLVLVIYFSFFRNIKDTIFYALFFGFLFDLFFGSFFGFYTVLFFIASWVSSAFSKDMKSVSLPRILAVIGLLTFIQSVFIGVSMYFSEISLTSIVLLYLFLQIGVNIGLGALIFSPIRRFFEILNKQDSFSKQKFKI